MDQTIKLSPRQQQVLDGMWRGELRKETAYRLGLTDLTVRNYRAHLYRKAGTTNAVSVVRWALEHHLLEVGR